MLAVAAYRGEDDIQGFDTTGDRRKQKPIRECLSEGLFCSLNPVLLTAISLFFILLLGFLASERMAVGVVYMAFPSAVPFLSPLSSLPSLSLLNFSPSRFKNKSNCYLLFPRSATEPNESGMVTIPTFQWWRLLGWSGPGAGEKERRATDSPLFLLLAFFARLTLSSIASVESPQNVRRPLLPGQMLPRDPVCILRALCLAHCKELCSQVHCASTLSLTRPRSVCFALTH